MIAERVVISDVLSGLLALPISSGANIFILTGNLANPNDAATDESKETPPPMDSPPSDFLRKPLRIDSKILLRPNGGNSKAGHPAGNKPKFKR